MLLDIEVVARQLLALIALTAAPLLAIAPIAPIAQPVITASTPKQLSLDRLEVLIQAYLAEKIA